MSGIRGMGRIFSSTMKNLPKVGGMKPSSLHQTKSSHLRGISTMQHAKFVGDKHLSGNMQPMNLCHLNIQSFIKSNSGMEKMSLKEDQFLSVDDLKGKFSQGQPVGVRLDGIADSGSVYGPNNHSVALVDIVHHNGEDHFLIFDGDHTQNPKTQQAVEQLAKKLDKDVEDISLSDLREAGLEHLVFRLEPVDSVMSLNRVELEENMSGGLDSMPKGPFYTVEPQKGFMETAQEVLKKLLGD
ncbi:hypothetical protein [Acanthopleuribacter pedis]|uniref:Uncharacterized protein n=1 Tax=Acanthopleuribacter pedis TaxID=442870 RepID=A0A8J7QFE9_9BACT|nr:hypothetical protein [Acanthopleuribacter pedis]MBO1323334.1 hypothetical protein [Acanthopleuribacter pedis]